ncbi:ribosome maturation factor RimM [Catalinimonas niigatensis]|uniref:ribosome maturation factor RimM n=1 Tax=Catalinimonas niigatensis TaxID=1397264 RepID=UPI00266553D4|nr:ribosome maturation factor RimM [Catalinimonas niigatensis]WPP53609.1 ribosome maturation factor RimM [Catalinimonas niigatensis]
MRIDDCYQLGYITKTHGLHGDVNVLLDVDFPEAYEEMESVFLQLSGSGTLIPFFIENLRLQKDSLIIKFEDIDELEQAEALLGAVLFLPLDQLPTLEEGQFYFHEIIGFQIEDENEGSLGTVKDVYEAGSQYLIAMDYQSQEVLIPLNDDIVLKVDKDNKTVFTRLPEGLLDVYIE